MGVNVDATNRHYLRQAIELMKDASRGTWMLVRAFNKNPEYERLRNQHSTQQRCLSSNNTRAAFVPPLDIIAEKAGNIVSKIPKL